MKRKSMVAALILGMCMMNLSGGTVLAAEQQNSETANTGDSSGTDSGQYTEEQINTLKKSLGVPDEEQVANVAVSDPWYWEGTGLWIVTVEMYDANGIFLAGASIDPDTLELERQIAMYDAQRVAQERAEKGLDASGNSQDQDTEDSDEGELQRGITTPLNNASDAVEIVHQMKGLMYIGDQSYNRSLQRNEDSTSSLKPEIGRGILAAFPMDFDGDGSKEIFSVTYDNSSQEGLGKVLHFLFMERAGESWNVVSDQEIVNSLAYTGAAANCLNDNCVKEEDMVFFRKQNGTYEFFYEEYDEGLIATGQEWFFRGFRLENGELTPIEETGELYYCGSPIDEFWENYDGAAGTAIEKFCSLGFSSPHVYFENMTADTNSGLYKILRMTRDMTCSGEEVNQWMASGTTQDVLDGFVSRVENKTGEIPETLEEAQPVQTGNTPFYGIWCYGSKGEADANSYAETLKSSGFDARVFVTTDWSNLNTEKFYVVTAGVYGSEAEANSALASVQSVYPDAYVKYSGDFQG